MDTFSLRKRLHLYIPITIASIILHSVLHPLLKIQWFSPFVSFLDAILNLYFRSRKLSPCIVNVDDQTSMHFWGPRRPDPSKPNLLMIHGYGGDSKWQFMYQVGQLAQSFNLYLPDLVFFGKSYSTGADRSPAFQAKCVAQGMKRLGVAAGYSVYSISYGGYVAYSMAEMYPETVEKMVIVSSAVVWTEEQKVEQLGKLGKDIVDLLLPQKPEDLRLLLKMTMHKYDSFRGYPDSFLQGFINSIGMKNRKERKELVEHLLARRADRDLPIIPQETLLVWGDKDRVFPLTFGRQLQRHLGSKAKLKILKDTGHAANMESAPLLNGYIQAFLLDDDASKAK